MSPSTIPKNRSLTVDLKMNIPKPVHFALEIGYLRDDCTLEPLTGLKAAEPFFRGSRMESTIDRLERQLNESGRLDAWNNEGLLKRRLEESYGAGFKCLYEDIDFTKNTADLDEDDIEDVECLEETLDFFQKRDGMDEFIDDEGCAMTAVNTEQTVSPERVMVYSTQSNGEHYSKFLRRNNGLATKLANRLTNCAETDANVVATLVNAFIQHSKHLSEGYGHFMDQLIKELSTMIDVHLLSRRLFEDFVDPLQLSFFNSEKKRIPSNKFRKKCSEYHQRENSANN